MFLMIVKLVIHKNLAEISIWNKQGDRLYYSDKEVDVKVAKDLLTVIRKKTDKEILEEKISGNVVTPQMEQRMFGYFNACWLNKIVQLKKRADGYDW